MQRAIAGECYRTTMLCIDKYEQGVPVGRFYNAGGEHCCVFHSLTQFLTEMEVMLDKTALPQSFTAARQFRCTNENSRGWTPRETAKPGGLATFSIRVLFRQNASWQGSVKWLEGGEEQAFRSALELIFLIDSVLTGAEQQQAV